MNIWKKILQFEKSTHNNTDINLYCKVKSLELVKAISMCVILMSLVSNINRCLVLLKQLQEWFFIIWGNARLWYWKQFCLPSVMSLMRKNQKPITVAVGGCRMFTILILELIAATQVVFLESWCSMLMKYFSLVPLCTAQSSLGFSLGPGIYVIA